MSDPVLPSRSEAWRLRIVLFAVAGMAYLATPRITGETFKLDGRFPRFAAAFLDGRLYVENTRAPGEVIEELIPTPDGSQLYLAYPPLPSILLMPFVWLLGAGGISSQLACRLMSALNVALFDACAVRLAKLLGRPPLNASERIGLGIFFAFGTVAWHNAQFGGDWHYAHAVATGALLGGLHELAGKRRATVLGLWIAAAMFTRPTAALCGAFFVLPMLRSRDYAALARCLTMVGAGVVCLGAYNQVRFGDPLDFGYSRMLLTGMGERLMVEYGQFNIRFVSQNAFWYFLAPPWISGGAAPALKYDPRGLSLFLASPALLYVVVAVRRHLSRPLMRDALISIALAVVPLLAYFNTGFWQFGHRFSLDYLPILLVLMIWGMGPRWTRIAWMLLALSVVIQIWGIFFASAAPLPAWLAPST